MPCVAGITSISGEYSSFFCQISKVSQFGRNYGGMTETDELIPRK